jgi:TolA-binding protein
MSERDHDDLDREDLVARARRGLLSAGEHTTLERALERDPALQAAYRVGVELDRAGAVQGGDAALIARAADAAIARATAMTPRTRSAGKTRWAAAAAVGLSVIFASGVATALFTGALPWPFQRATISASDPAPARIRAPKPKHARRDPPRAEPTEVLAPTEPAPLPRAEDKPARTPSGPTAERAAELFHEANNARRDGDLAHARRLYSQLIATHPSSDEAGLARVSLGRLLLAAGDARGAERELRRYLATGGGQLREEALVGRAQSLSSLGRKADERAAWLRLLDEHPSSVYAAQARQRLAELERDPAGTTDEGAR